MIYESLLYSTEICVFRHKLHLSYIQSTAPKRYTQNRRFLRYKFQKLPILGIIRKCFIRLIPKLLSPAKRQYQREYSPI
jgi:hypothetical protein